MRELSCIASKLKAGYSVPGVLRSNKIVLSNTKWEENDGSGKAYIVNDDRNFKKLILAGNDAGGDGTRRVGVWDDMEISRDLKVNRNLNTAGTITTPTINTTNLNVEKFNLLPRGIIVAWNSSSAPSGWVLCDGNNGTPDLRNRFILGGGYSGGPSKGLNSIGGEERHTLTLDELPNHRHEQVAIANRDNGGPGIRSMYNYDARGMPEYPAGGRTLGAGGDQPHNIMPPYYVLAYIMKT
jgi:microcystin-dependent protein